MDLLPPIDLLDQALGHGEVLESQVTRALVNVPFSSQRKVYRLDRTAGSLNIVDDTTVATSGTSNAFSPFGANVLGAAATIKVYDSTDGIWASHELAATAQRADGTAHASVIACLKETGWCSITFGEDADRRDWRPSADPSAAIPARKYIRIELDDGADKDSIIVACGLSDITAVLLNVTTAGGTAAAVRLAEVVLVRRAADIKWVDVTTGSEGVQGDILTPYTPAASTWIPIVGSETWYGLESIGNGFEEHLFRRSGASGTWEMRVTGAGEAVISVADYVSGSAFHTDGPAGPAVAAAQHKSSTYTPPAGWVKRSLGTFTLEDGTSLVTPPLYWFGYRLTAVTDASPQQTSAARVRARQFGGANVQGITVPAAVSYTALELDMRGVKSGTGDRTLQVANLSTGQVRSVVIPTATLAGESPRFTFAALAFAAGEQLGVLIVPGGAQYTDVYPILG